MTQNKISLNVARKMPPAQLLRLINKMKAKLKKDSVMQGVFDEYDVDIEELDLYPMFFKDLDVSAKTDHGVIYFNYSLLCDGEFEENYSYAIHEVTHVLQQTTGDKPTQSSDDGNYLKNPFEEEGFANQVEYIANHKGKDEAVEYVDNLLDHHDVEDKKDKKEIKETLLAKV